MVSYILKDCDFGDYLEPMLPGTLLYKTFLSLNSMTKPLSMNTEHTQRRIWDQYNQPDTLCGCDGDCTRCGG